MLASQCLLSSRVSHLCRGLWCAVIQNVLRLWKPGSQGSDQGQAESAGLGSSNCRPLLVVTCITCRIRPSTSDLVATGGAVLEQSVKFSAESEVDNYGLSYFRLYLHIATSACAQSQKSRMMERHVPIACIGGILRSTPLGGCLPPHFWSCVASLLMTLGLAMSYGACCCRPCTRGTQACSGVEACIAKSQHAGWTAYCAWGPAAAKHHGPSE